MSVPAYTGHNPLRTLNKDDLPHPLGPVISRCSPGFIVSVRLETTTSLFGVIMGTSYSDMLPSVLFFTIPKKKKKNSAHTGKTLISWYSWLALAKT